MRTIDADAYAAEIKKRQDGCQWRLDNPVGNTFYTEHEYWMGVFAAFVEAKLTLDNMPTVGDWISVKDRLPEEKGEYIVFDGDDVFGAYYDAYDRRWTDTTEGYFEFRVTHWRPMPEPPKEVSGDDA